MKHLKIYDHKSKFDGVHDQPIEKDISNDEIGTGSLTNLVRNILDACKLDVDEIEYEDPDFIPYISNMILEWSIKK